MRVEFSFFAGLLVIATALLARVKIQGLLGALQWTALNAALAARAGSRILRQMSRWIG